MQLPTTANDFISFMENVWDGNCEPDGNGGLICYMNNLYDEYHDAIMTARKCGMSRTGGSSIDNVPIEVYRFPNGQGVRISRDGNTLYGVAVRFGRKK